MLLAPMRSTISRGSTISAADTRRWAIAGAAHTVATPVCSPPSAKGTYHDDTAILDALDSAGDRPITINRNCQSSPDLLAFASNRNVECSTPCALRPFC